MDTLVTYAVVGTRLGTMLIAVVGTKETAVVGTRLMTVTRSVIVLFTVNVLETVGPGTVIFTPGSVTVLETVGPGTVMFIPGSVTVLISDCIS
jgi:hypothetical protein